MHASGIIASTQSEGTSPVLPAPKPDGSLRLCVYYGRLNVVKIKDTYPIPRMYKFLDSLGDKKIFPALYTIFGYLQVSIPEEEKPKTAFSFLSGPYQFNGIPFG